MLKRLGYDIRGIDIDPGRIQKMLEITGLDIKRCSAEVEPIPHEDEEFDCVLMTELFEHLRLDPLFVLSEINRILKPDGIFYLSTPNLYGIDTIGKYIRGAGINNPLKQFLFLRDKGHMGHIREYSNREMKQLLGYSGFDTKKTYYHNYHKYDHGIVWLMVSMFQLFFPKTGTRQIIIAKKRHRRNPLSSLFISEARRDEG
jgi:SAM-dependent methyltransferase